jgi:hypothetical protein
MIQHYVPKVYLRNFGEKKTKGNKSEYFVDVYDKINDSFFKTNIKNICAERHFYTLDDETKVAKDKMAVERTYSDFIEPMYQRAYEILTDDKVDIINEQQRSEILIGIMQLYSRNPSVLSQMQENAEANVKKMINDNRGRGIKGVTFLEQDYSFRDYTDDLILKLVLDQTTKVFKERHLDATKEILKFHAEAKFQVEKLRDESSYFTSDNPLVMTDSLTDKVHPLLRSKEFRITLNKKYSLLIQHDNRRSKNRLHKCFKASGNAWSTNADILEHSSRFVIADDAEVKAHKKMELLMNDEDPEKIISLLRQVIDKFEGDRESEKSRGAMKEFLSRYDNGGTSNEDFQGMFREVMLFNREMMHNRIKKE